MKPTLTRMSITAAVSICLSVPVFATEVQPIGNSGSEQLEGDLAKAGRLSGLLSDEQKFYGVSAKGLGDGRTLESRFLQSTSVSNTVIPPVLSQELPLSQICAATRETQGDQVSQIQPSTVEASLNQGQFFLRAKRYEEALMVYNHAISLNASNADVWIGCSLVLKQIGRYEEAIAALNKAIEISPNYSLAWLNKGIFLKDTSQYEDALVALERSIAGNQQWGEYTLADAWINRGSVLWQLAQPQEAIAAFDKAIELNPEFSLAWYNRGTAFLQQGARFLQQQKTSEATVSLEQSILSFERALASQGQWGETTGPASAWYNRGVALELLERYPEAIESYDQALRITPNHTKAREQLAKLRERLEEQL